jgi:transcriptional regulator GlxA family with amidase domain
MLTNTIASTEEIWSLEGRRLEEIVFNAQTDLERIEAVEEFLLQQLDRVAARPRLEAAVAEVIRSCGQTRVDQLASMVGLSSRQLEREFRSGAGLSPKALARVIRFQNLLRLVGEGTLREWATLALATGYADQPHMVREFREFTGQSPTERQLALNGDFARHFVSPERLATLLGV